MADVMSVLDEESAAENDKLQLFTSPERFPKVPTLRRLDVLT